MWNDINVFYLHDLTMWLQQRLKALPSLLSSSWARRLLVVLLVFLIFYWYRSADGLFKFPSFFRSTGGAVGICLQPDIARWTQLAEQGEGVLNSLQTKVPLPFVTGNGHILVDVDANKLWVASSSLPGSAPIHQTEYPPLVQWRVPTMQSEAQVKMLWYRKGSILSSRCILVGNSQASRDCVIIREEYIAHRSKPNVFIQRIHISNPTEKGVSIESFVEPSSFRSAAEKVDDKEFMLSTGKVLTEKKDTVLLAVAMKRLNSHFQVPAKSEYTDNIVSVIHTSEPIEPFKVEETNNRLRDAVRKEMAEVLRVNLEDVVQEHQQVWTDFFISGKSNQLS